MVRAAGRWWGAAGCVLGSGAGNGPALVSHSGTIASSATWPARSSARACQARSRMLTSVAIQHAPWADDRREWVRAMVEQLRDEAPELPVAIVADEARSGCWPTFRRALESGQSGTHHLLLQDDLELC